MRTIPPASGEYNWSGFIRGRAAYKHVYVLFLGDIPDYKLPSGMTTALAQSLLIPYLQQAKIYTILTEWNPVRVLLSDLLKFNIKGYPKS